MVNDVGKQTAYMKSNYKRRKNDTYKTIDTRCVDALLYFWSRRFKNTDARIVDVCSANGSAIVDYLRKKGYKAKGAKNAFAKNIGGDWITTNPPYSLDVVDDIINFQIQRLKAGEVRGVAMLMRTGFDHASTRADIFGDNPHYWGQIKLRFRPWWTKSRRLPPFHFFVWHIWTFGLNKNKRVVYYSAPYDRQYAAKPRKKNNA